MESPFAPWTSWEVWDFVTPPLRRLRPCLLLLPVGALPADRVALRTAVSALGSWRSFFFCIT